jgi:hypothetical protein
LLREFARPGPEPIVIVKSSTTQPTAMRSSTALAPGRICSIKENAGSVPLFVRPPKPKTKA